MFLFLFFPSSLPLLNLHAIYSQSTFTMLSTSKLYGVNISNSKLILILTAEAAIAEAAIAEAAIAEAAIADYTWGRASSKLTTP